MDATRTISVDFIRLLFTSPVQEEVAHRWASRLATLLGPQVMHLRPSTTLAELLKWAAASGADSIDFAVVFEPELRREFGRFLERPQQVTFRELVEYYAAWFGDARCGPASE